MNAAAEFRIDNLSNQRPSPERWLRVVPPVQGESLTSRLGRQAKLWDISIHSLLKDLLVAGGRPIPDLDVAPPHDLVAQIAARLGESPFQTEGATLRAVLPHLMPFGQLAKISFQRWKPSHLSWILPSGWQQNPSLKARPNGGIPFCPVCVMESPIHHSPLHHRLAFQVCCPTHHIWLLDKCPTCESRTSPAVVDLHAETVDGVPGIRCGNCPPMLPTRSPEISHADPLTLHLQNALSDGLVNGQVPGSQLGLFPTVQFLRGLRFVFMAVDWLRVQGVSLPPARNEKAFPPALRAQGQHQGPFETLALPERIFRMKGAAWICEAPLDRWALLHQLCAWPNNLPRTWRHPWEGLTESGELLHQARKTTSAANAAGARDPFKVQAFFDLVDHLGLHPVRVQGLLGNISSNRYHRWRNQPTTRLSLDCYRRMEAFLRLWDRLLTFFNTQSIAQEWVIKPNRHPLFGGLAPIDAFSGPGTLHKFEASISMFGGVPQD